MVGLATVSRGEAGATANIIVTYEFTKRLAGTDVTTNHMLPGLVRTNLVERAGWRGITLGHL